MSGLYLDQEGFSPLVTHLSLRKGITRAVSQGCPAELRVDVRASFPWRAVAQATFFQPDESFVFELNRTYGGVAAELSVSQVPDRVLFSQDNPERLLRFARGFEGCIVFEAFTQTASTQADRSKQLALLMLKKNPFNVCFSTGDTYFRMKQTDTGTTATVGLHVTNAGQLGNYTHRLDALLREFSPTHLSRNWSVSQPPSLLERALLYVKSAYEPAHHYDTFTRF